jgi:hypothetical protein
MTFLELFGLAYMSPQEVSVEANIPLEIVYRMRSGGSVSERDARRVLQVVNSRLPRRIGLHQLPAEQIQWE